MDSTSGTKRRMSAKERKDMKRRKKNEDKAAAAAVPREPPTQPQPQTPSKSKKSQGKQPQQEAAPLSAAAVAIVAAIEGKRVRGTLSDRLNPKHRLHDATLKATWKSFTKKERNAIVRADRNLIDTAAAAVTAIVHPFKVALDDHCESPAEAYRDVAPFLECIAASLGKTKAELLIYDPYYCAGAMTKHLNALGFINVHNKCEDFYNVIYTKTVPEHDVVVTNPPYSGSHVEKLLRFVRGNGKPFLLLMPNYFVAKPYYETLLAETAAIVRDSMLYLAPRKRYQYWTPRGLRPADRVQKHHVGAGGQYRTSPFISFWYLNLKPVRTQSEVLSWWSKREKAAGASGAGDTVLSRVEELHPGVRPGNLSNVEFTNTKTAVTGMISMLDTDNGNGGSAADDGGNGGGLFAAAPAAPAHGPTPVGDDGGSSSAPNVGGSISSNVGGGVGSTAAAAAAAAASNKGDYRDAAAAEASDASAGAGADAGAGAGADDKLLQTLLAAGMELETASAMIAAKTEKEKESKKGKKKSKRKKEKKEKKKEAEKIEKAAEQLSLLKEQLREVKAAAAQLTFGREKKEKKRGKSNK